MPNNPDSQLAMRFVSHPNEHQLAIPVSHDYRRRWWLPRLGPTASCLLNHLDSDRTSDWRVLEVHELATHLGIGHKRNLRLLNSALQRLVQFGFGYFDIAPDDPAGSTCVTFYNTTRPVPQGIVAEWPPNLRMEHDASLGELVRIHDTTYQLASQ